MTLAPIAAYGGPGTYANGPSGFLGPFQLCANVTVYDTMGTSNRRYYLMSGSTLYLKNAFNHYVYLMGGSQLYKIGNDPGNIYVYHMINAGVNGAITPPPTTCAAVSFPTITCPSPTATSVNEIISDKDFEIYPNPVSNVITIAGGEASELNVSMCDFTGSVVKRAPVSQGAVLLDVSSLPNGIYFLRIEEPGKAITSKKILVVH